MITIRPFENNDRDYQQAVDIMNTVWPEYPDTVEEWKESDEKRSKLVKRGRFFAEIDETPVGFANYGQSLWLNHPGKLFIGVEVLPEFRKRGVGTALWERLCQEIQQFDPLRLLAHTREDYEDGIRFAQKLGFNECMRDWESRLDPASLDLDEWSRYPRQVAEQGIEIKTVAELASDPNRDRKLYELEWLIDRDVPSPEPPSKVPFEEFQKVWERTNLLPGCLVRCSRQWRICGNDQSVDEPGKFQVALRWNNRRGQIPSKARHCDGPESPFGGVCAAKGFQRNPNLERDQQPGDAGDQQPARLCAAARSHRVHEGDAGGASRGRRSEDSKRGQGRGEAGSRSQLRTFGRAAG